MANGTQQVQAQGVALGSWAGHVLYLVLRTLSSRRVSPSFSRVRAASLLTFRLIDSALRIIVTATVQGILSCLTAAFWGSVRPPLPRIRWPCLVG